MGKGFDNHCQDCCGGCGTWKRVGVVIHSISLRANGEGEDDTPLHALPMHLVTRVDQHLVEGEEQAVPGFREGDGNPCA